MRDDAIGVLCCVWLRPSFDDHASSWVLLIDSCVIVQRVVAKVIPWQGRQRELERLYRWAGAQRTDEETRKVMFEAAGKVYDLRVIAPDPGAEVCWQEDGDEEAVLVGRPTGNFPMRTRLENGINVPREVDLVVNAPVPVPEPDMDGQKAAEVGGVPGSGNGVGTAQTTGTDESEKLVGGSASEAGKKRKRRKATRGTASKSVVISTADSQSSESKSSEELTAEPATSSESKSLEELTAEPTAMVAGRDEEDEQETLVLDVSSRGRVRRRSYRVMATQVAGSHEKEDEMLTTRIAKGVHEYNALVGEMKRRARDALVAEIKNLIVDHASMEGVTLDAIEDGDEVLSVNVIIEEKAVNGRFVKDKARIIAGGHRQVKKEFAELSSQTVNTESVFILLAVAAYEKRSLMVIDVKGAYLNADMEGPRGRRTYVEVPPWLASIFVEVEPTLGHFVDRKGVLRMRVVKALYGCIQSAALWQQTLSKALIDMGFRISNYDPCVAISSTGNIILCFHVDDILVIGRQPQDCERFKRDFGERFTITSKMGGGLDYLGLHIEETGDGLVLAQDAMVKKLVARVPGTANSPAAAMDSEEGMSEEELLELEEKLPQKEAAEFRSVAAGALYISKRTRPDVMWAVNQLCRKAHEPTRRDSKALNRLLRYLSRTRSKVLLLPARGLEVTAYIDASFATNSDKKSTTGAVILVGGAVVWAKSLNRITW